MENSAIKNLRELRRYFGGRHLNQCAFDESFKEEIEEELLRENDKKNKNWK